MNEITLHIDLTKRERELLSITLQKKELYLFQHRKISTPLFKLIHPPSQHLTLFEYIIFLRRYLQNHCYIDDDANIYFDKPFFRILNLDESTEKISFPEFLYRIFPHFSIQLRDLHPMFIFKNIDLDTFLKMVNDSFYKKMN